MMSSRSFLETMCSTIWLNNNLNVRDETDPDKKDAMKKNAIKAWGGWMLIALRRSNPGMAKLQKQIQSQFSLGHNQNPDSMEKATDILSNHKIDAKYYELQKKKREQEKTARGRRADQVDKLCSDGQRVDMPLLWKERPQKHRMQAPEHYPEEGLVF